ARLCGRGDDRGDDGRAADVCRLQCAPRPPSPCRGMMAEDRPLIRTGKAGGSRYFAAIEALRGVAILLVFLFHAESSTGLGLTGTHWTLLMGFVRAGQTGVSLFLVISAFLLSLPFLAEAEGGRRVARGRYFARRALRILPLYYVVVITASMLTAQ